MTPDPSSELRLCPACSVAWAEEDRRELDAVWDRVAAAA